jgi:hypothetical protein
MELYNIKNLTIINVVKEKELIKKDEALIRVGNLTPNLTLF